MFDAQQYLKDRGIPFTPPGASKNVSSGWIGITCPLCDDRSDHGAFRLADGHYSCWRCPGGSLEDVIMALEGCNWQTAHRIVSSYSRAVPAHVLDQYMREGPRPKTVEMPPGTRRMRLSHRSYLRDRGFDDELLEAEFGLLGTGPVGPYALRIIAPITYDGKIVSYQGRDITGQARARYKACPKDKEVIHHKHMLYNIDSVKPGGPVLVVEGITDVWRMGSGSVATFGTSYTPAQVACLAERKPSRVFILFDPEHNAQYKAKGLAHEIAGACGCPVENILLHGGDPGSLPQAEAHELRKELGL